MIDAAAQIGNYVAQFLLVVGLSCLQPRNWESCRSPWLQPYVCDAAELLVNGPYAEQRQKLKSLRDGSN